MGQHMGCRPQLFPRISGPVKHLKMPECAEVSRSTRLSWGPGPSFRRFERVREHLSKVQWRTHRPAPSRWLAGGSRGTSPKSTQMQVRSRLSPRDPSEPFSHLSDLARLVSVLSGKNFEHIKAESAKDRSLRSDSCSSDLISQGPSDRIGVNQFGDMTNQETGAQLCCHLRSKCSEFIC